MWKEKTPMLLDFTNTVKNDREIILDLICECRSLVKNKPKIAM